MQQDIYFLDGFGKEVRVGDIAAYIKTGYSDAKGRVYSITLGKNGFYNVVIECLVDSYGRKIGEFTKPVSNQYVFKLEL